MNSEQPLVVIVLSTFNGERHVAEQMDSLFAQTYENIQIIVRDDGSTDRTVKILEGLTAGRTNCHVVSEQNIGVVGSFLRLFNMVPTAADFVALCDQDDVWHEDKIERAVTMLSEVRSTAPAMYCGAVAVVDGQLNYIRTLSLAQREVGLENALVQNVAIGCTVLVNKATVQLVINRDVEVDRIGMHDWWLYQLVAAFGRVVFDREPKISYRQHGDNVVGSATGISKWIKRVKRQWGGKPHRIRRQGEELLRLYGSEMPPEKREMVYEFLDRSQSTQIMDRLDYARRAPVFRQAQVDDILMRAMILFARI